MQNALATRGISGAVRSIRISPAASRRRAVFSARKTKKGSIIGFHHAGSSVIGEIPDCLILTPEILDAIPDLSEVCSIGGSRNRELRFFVTATDTGLDVSVRGGKPMTLDLSEAIVALLQSTRIARLTWDDEPVATFQTPVITVGTAQVVPTPGCFLQATKQGELALQAAVLEVVHDLEGPIVDLFSGLGTFTFPLAVSHDVHAIESDAFMLEALSMGWRRGAGLRQVSTERRDLFRQPLRPTELSEYSAAVIDPPRAGAEAQTHALADSCLRRIAFVSCNPVTFARDAEILVNAGYRLDWIDVVDQFRWSPHVELVAQFSLD